MSVCVCLGGGGGGGGGTYRSEYSFKCDGHYGVFTICPLMILISVYKKFEQVLVLASMYFWPLLCTDSICFTLIQLYWLTGCNKSS